ncbi:DUF2249 domain-containing protein [Salinigranum salinum]|uniref:DUF2249 domain-containing protein n=1 Tax=Salinigranum salinum TaxID=1364937 RepID=UPI0012608546|nr:DUF2249 domain-containing protein [Salinigranum salinum]
MSETARLPPALESTVPTDRAVVAVDVATAPPPEPLTRTLEALATLDDDELLLQVNDREPTYLFPKLDDRGAAYATAERVETVVTAIWYP